jgi:glycosyltransferase involved in cell wall biosynthesis
MVQQPYFSVVIPTRNRPEQLGTCLRALSRLDYPRDCFEVIVVDDGGAVSLVDTLAPVKAAVRVSLIEQHRQGLSRARNAGAAKAAGDFLAFTADDCEPATDWLKRLARRCTARLDCAWGGQIVNSLEENAYSAASHLLIMYLYSYYNAQHDAARFFTPNNLTVPKDGFLAIGGFDPCFITEAGEDRGFCERWLRSGYPMQYAPDAVVSHRHPLTLRSFCRQQFEYGRGTFRYRRLQAELESRRISIEPARFYFNLLCYPFAVSHDAKFQLAALLGVSQAANALGFFWEASARPPSRRS